MSWYKEIAVVRVEHEYFEDFLSSYFELTLTKETKELMRRRGIVMKEKAHNIFSFLVEEGNSGFFDDDSMKMEFRPKDPNFFLYTDMGDFDMLSQYTLRGKSGIVDVGKSLEREDRNRYGGSLFLLEIPLSVEYQEEMVLKFKAKFLRWGYIIVSNTGNIANRSYCMESSEDSIAFRHPELIDLPWQGGDKGVLIASSEKIPLRARNIQKMTLYEMDAQRPKFRRVVQKNIEPPVVGEVLEKNVSKNLVVRLLYV
ncbi:MAG: hypothetical protein J6Y37_08875 [Paludibacteraceae bacterium]|nr:hypothetical protein [Paludibacteraceae bacterium]